MYKRGNSFTKLLLLFTLVPLAELFILFNVAKATNWILTIVLVIVTGIIGAQLAKSQGRQILKKIHIDLSEGRLPGEELLNGLCVLIGGALLIAPGIITDVLGLTLIFPATRILYKKFMKRKFTNMMQNKDVNIFWINGQGN